MTTKILALAICLGLLLGIFNPLASFTSEFILIGGDGDKPSLPQNLLMQETDDGNALDDIYDVTFINSRRGDQSSKVEEEIDSTDYASYVLAGYSRGGLSIIMYKNIDERVDTIVLIDAMTMIYGAGIIRDSQLVDKWIDWIIDIANSGCNIIITASSDTSHNISQHSRMVIEGIEENSESDSPDFDKISEGEYVIRGNPESGHISTKIFEGEHGDACIESFDYIYEKLK